MVAMACLSIDTWIKNNQNTSGRDCASSVTNISTYPQHAQKETRTTSHLGDNTSLDQGRMHKAGMVSQRCMPLWQNWMRKNEKPSMWLSIMRVFRLVAWTNISPHHFSCLICTCSPGWKRIDVSSNPTTDRQLRNCWNKHAPWLRSRQSIHQWKLCQNPRIPLPQPIKCKNVNGTPNKLGTINYAMTL